MLASLPMYDHPALREETDRFWQAIRAAFGDGPDHLTRDGDLWAQWQSPDLMLSQTCGYPYRARLHGSVTLVGAPDYGLPGCGPGRYNSVFVARRDHMRRPLAAFEGACFAYNEPMSQSGWAGPMIHLKRLGSGPGRFVQTGSHARSARAVAEGKADLAALDALSWKLIQRYEPYAQNLHVLAQTRPTPALPYITARAEHARALFGAIETAIQTLSSADRAALSLEGIVEVDPASYLAVPSPPPPPE